MPIERAHKTAEGSEDVVATKINAAKALERFKGLQLESDGVDFSSRLGSRAGTHGYTVRAEYGLAGAGESESPLERFNRLQSEVKELLGSLEAAAASSAAPGDGAATAGLVGDVVFLQQQLQRVKLDALLGTAPDALKPTPGLQDDLNKRLLAEIAKAGKTAPAAGPAGPGAANAEGVTYELYYQPEHAKFAQAAKLSNLEQRLERLEASMGTESLLPLAADLDTPNVTLNVAVVNLTRRVVALSSENLGDTQRRVDHLLHQVEVLKGKVPDAVATGAGISDHADKVRSLHDIATRWDSVATAVPTVIERLQSLKALHERGAEFGQTLTELESVQAQLQESLRLQGAVLSTVETSLAANLATIQANFAAVDGRVAALTANLAKISKP